jgi:hypothetical protein
MPELTLSPHPVRRDYELGYWVFSDTVPSFGMYQIEKLPCQELKKTKEIYCKEYNPKLYKS